MPTTEAGKSISSQNALKHGLFAATDFIRPDEQHLYVELDQAVRQDLTPQGILEYSLVDEIRRAMWRLRRCGEVESHLVLRLDDGGSFILDPMETVNAQAEKIQKSVDRARAQAHRLLHKCTAELRKLQTERQFRNEFFPEEADISHLGVADFQSLHKTLTRPNATDERHADAATDDAPEAQATEAAPEPRSSFCKTTGPAATAPAPQMAPPTNQTARNAPCPCNSGEKYKRCCGRTAPPLRQAA